MTSLNRKDLSILEVPFDGIIDSNVRSAITKEFVKYIVYERGIIPIYYDHLKQLTQVNNWSIHQLLGWIFIFKSTYKINTFNDFLCKVTE